MSDVTISFDGSGGAYNCAPSHPRWNDTKGAWGFVAVGHGGGTVYQDSGIIAPCNSPIAELTACLRGVEWAVSQRYRAVSIRGDSKFVIDWLRGMHRTSLLPHIAPLQYQLAQLVAHEVVTDGNRRRIRLLDTPQKGRVLLDPIYIPRSRNFFADKLCTQALKADATSSGG